MREASFILPKGEDLTAAHEAARGELLRHFGGYSYTDVFGEWRDDQGATVYDKSYEYRVAADWTDEKRNVFAGLALRAGMAARQDAVYVKMDDGACYIWSCDENEPAPEFGVGRWLLGAAGGFLAVIALIIMAVW